MSAKWQSNPMKIKLHLLAWNSRHGDSGAEVRPTKRSCVESLAQWLEDYMDDECKAEVKTLLDKGELQAAEFKIAEAADGSGNDWTIDYAIIDPSEFEFLPTGEHSSAVVNAP